MSVFDNFGGNRTIKIPELDDYNLVDAKYEDQVLMVKGIKNIVQNGVTQQQADKFIFVIDKHFNNYSTRELTGIGSEEVNFSVIGAKKIACHIREDSIELFSNNINASDIKEIEESDTSQFIATKSSDFLTAIQGDSLVRITMK